MKVTSSDVQKAQRQAWFLILGLFETAYLLGIYPDDVAKSNVIHSIMIANKTLLDNYTTIDIIMKDAKDKGIDLFKNV